MKNSPPLVPLSEDEGEMEDVLHRLQPRRPRECRFCGVIFLSESDDCLSPQAAVFCANFRPMVQQ